MEKSTGLFITSLCSLFIIHSSCLRPLSLSLSDYPLPHCTIIPYSSCHHSSSLSSSPCPSPRFSVICGPTPRFSLHLCTGTPPPLFYIVSAFLRPTLTSINVSFSSLLAVHSSLYSPLQEEVWTEGWTDVWTDG